MFTTNQLSRRQSPPSGPWTRKKVASPQPDSNQEKAKADKPKKSLGRKIAAAGFLTLAGLGALGGMSEMGTLPGNVDVDSFVWDEHVDVAGDWAGQDVDLRVDYHNDGDMGIKGELDGQNVNVAMEGTTSGYEVNGQWAGQNVDLDVHSNNGDSLITGNVDGQAVRLDVDETQGDYEVTGNWGGKTVSLDVDQEEGDYFISGQWGNEEVKLKMDENWADDVRTTGEAPAEMILPWLVADNAG